MPADWVGTGLLATYVKADKTAETAALSKELLPASSQESEPATTVVSILRPYALSLLNEERFAEAQLITKQYVDVYPDTDPNRWFKYEGMSLLGAALLDQQKLAEAEPLLVQGYEGLNSQAVKSHILLKARI